MTTVVVQGGGGTVVVQDRRPTQSTTRQDNVTTVRDSRTPVTVTGAQTPVQVNDRRPTIAVGSNIGMRGPAGPSGDAIAPIGFSWGDAPSAIFTAPAAGVLTVARLAIRTQFNGVGASIRVGTPGAPEAVLAAADIDPYRLAEFENTPDLTLAQGETVILSITPGSADAGSGVIYLSFLQS